MLLMKHREIWIESEGNYEKDVVIHLCKSKLVLDLGNNKREKLWKKKNKKKC